MFFKRSFSTIILNGVQEPPIILIVVKRIQKPKWISILTPRSYGWKKGWTFREGFVSLKLTAFPV
jgi:hypothetical protein